MEGRTSLDDAKLILAKAQCEYMREVNQKKQSKSSNTRSIVRERLVVLLGNVSVNFLKKMLIVLLSLLVLTVSVTFGESEVYIVDEDSKELSLSTIVDLSEHEKFSLHQSIVLEHNKLFEEDIMNIHKDFIRQTASLGYLSRVNHLLYEEKLEKYHIESRVRIRDTRFKGASKVFSTRYNIRDYSILDVHSNDVISVHAYIATTNGCIEGLGGELEYSVKEDTFIYEITGEELIQQWRAAEKK